MFSQTSSLPAFSPTASTPTTTSTNTTIWTGTQPYACSTVTLADLGNAPPPAYCNTYCRAPPAPSLDTAAHLLFQAAKRSPARCPHTGIETITPLIAQKWAELLLAARYPSLEGAVTLVQCLRDGVSLGYDGQRSTGAIGGNLRTASQNPEAIDNDIAKQLALGRRRGPYETAPLPAFRANPLGVVFRRAGSKPRVIHHLSWPRDGDSVNASVREFDVRLDAFDRAVSALRTCGRGAHMAKIDIEAAYRCIPVRPEDWALQGMRWRGKYYFDIVVQFGLASATAIFEWYSSAAEFIVRRLRSVRHLLHYVDDFFLLHPHKDGCERELKFVLEIFALLGLPVSAEKLEGPLTAIIFLGILFDSVAMTLSLAHDKLTQLKDMVAEWMSRTTASRRELQSLCGMLNFAAKVVRSGRTFLRRMIDEQKAIPTSASSDDQFPLSPSFFKDLRWWATYLPAWNGKALVPPDVKEEDKLIVYTDACKDGYGALTSSEWFAGIWSADERAEAQRDERYSMPWMELHTIVRAAATWGLRWAGRHVLVRTDCQPIVAAWEKGDSPQPALAQLIRTLLLITATHDFTLQLVHLPGIDNTHADLLSRGQVTSFLALQTAHSRSPIIPSPLPTQRW